MILRKTQRKTEPAAAVMPQNVAHTKINSLNLYYPNLYYPHRIEPFALIRHDKPLGQKLDTRPRHMALPVLIVYHSLLKGRVYEHGDFRNALRYGVHPLM